MRAAFFFHQAKKLDEKLRHKVQLRLSLCRKRFRIRGMARPKCTVIFLRCITNGRRLSLGYGGKQRRDCIRFLPMGVFCLFPVGVMQIKVFAFCF